MNNDLQNILVLLKKLFPYVNQEFRVSSLEVFGSFARNEQTNNSDLDVLVSFSEIPSLFKFVALKNYLSEHLGRKVDLVMKDSLKPRLRKSIINEAISV